MLQNYRLKKSPPMFSKNQTCILIRNAQFKKPLKTYKIKQKLITTSNLKNKKPNPIQFKHTVSKRHRKSPTPYLRSGVKFEFLTDIVIRCQDFVDSGRVMRKLIRLL